MSQVLPKGYMEVTAHEEAVMKVREAMEGSRAHMEVGVRKGLEQASREDSECCAKVWTKPLGARSC